MKTDNLKNIKNTTKKKLSELINNLPESINEICLIINSGQTDYYRYQNIPILENISASNFYNGMKKLSYEQQKKLIGSFEIRYGRKYSNGILKTEYYPDIEIIGKIASKFKVTKKSIIMSPKNFQRKILGERYEELYNWMVKQRKD